MRRFFLGLLLLLAVGCSRSHAQDQPTAPPGESVVVLELFTSQGCSSCPSADKVLSDLGVDPERKDKVLPLAYHVDYWDYIGWKDPFASSRWSDRQRRYGKHAFDTRRIYTPQLIINGRDHLVGSNRSSVHSRIDAASRLAAAAEIKASATRAAHTITVKGQVHMIRDAGKLDVLIIVFESKLNTRVSRGENTGRTLKNDFIVRRLVRASSFEGKIGTTANLDTQINLDPAWKPQNVGIAVLVQNTETMAVAGATKVAF
jgi:hypothetical protein